MIAYMNGLDEQLTATEGDGDKVGEADGIGERMNNVSRGKAYHVFDEREEEERGGEEETVVKRRREIVEANRERGIRLCFLEIKTLWREKMMNFIFSFF